MGVAESTLMGDPNLDVDDKSVVSDGVHVDENVIDDGSLSVDSGGNRYYDDGPPVNDKYKRRTQSGNVDANYRTPTRSKNVDGHHQRPRGSPSISSLGSDSPSRNIRPDLLLTPNFILRGAIIGCPKSGKTSLFRRLQGKDYHGKDDRNGRQRKQYNLSLDARQALEKANWATIRWRPQQSSKNSRQTSQQTETNQYDFAFTNESIVNVQILDVDLGDFENVNARSGKPDENDEVPKGLIHFFIWMLDPRKSLKMQEPFLRSILNIVREGRRIPLFIMLNFRDLISEEVVNNFSKAVKDLIIDEQIRVRANNQLIG